MSAYRIEGISEGIVLHPNIEGIKSYARMQAIFNHLFNLDTTDRSFVLEGGVERPGNMVHALILRWAERAETNSSGQRHYVAKGIALAVNSQARDGVDILRTDEIDGVWLSYHYRGQSQPHIKDFEGLTWDERLKQAYQRATPIDACLYKYASSILG